VLISRSASDGPNFVESKGCSRFAPVCAVNTLYLSLGHTRKEPLTRWFCWEDAVRWTTERETLDPLMVVRIHQGQSPTYR
jgi:hypothetical protein